MPYNEFERTVHRRGCIHQSTPAVRRHLALVLAITWTCSQAAEQTPWSPLERDVAIVGCARAIAEPAYDGYLKRNALAEPSAEHRQEVIELAIATDGLIWTMCACIMDAVAKRWGPSELPAHQTDVNALSAELANGKCKPEL